ncbi:MAG: hypothetical protein ACKOD2_01365 [Ilumatobacteraceae bacterium]
MILQHWGATEDEIEGPVVGDDLCPQARVVATRAITLAVPPEEVFPWIRQMGFGRAGWYSYDWIDNLGRSSARVIEPAWQDVHTGSTVPGGPIHFDAALVDPPRSFVLRYAPASGRILFVLAYELRAHPAGTRLVTRMRSQCAFPGGASIDRFVLGPGDGIMVRKQLLTLQRRVAG